MISGKVPFKTNSLSICFGQKNQTAYINKHHSKINKFFDPFDIYNIDETVNVLLVFEFSKCDFNFMIILQYRFYFIFKDIHQEK